MSNCDNKEVVEIRGIPYSVYCDVNVNFVEEVETKCPVCGTETTMCPITDIEIYEVFDARTMVEKTCSTLFFDALKKAIEKDYVQWHSICADCMDGIAEIGER